MAKQIPAGHGRYRIEDSNQTYVLAKDVLHRAATDISAIVINRDATGDTIIIRGELEQVIQDQGATANWIVQALGDDTTFNIAASGSILGAGGLDFTGANAVINNAGLISTTDSELVANAIETKSANVSITNTGTIESKHNIAVMIAAGEGGHIDNNGTLRGFDGIEVNSSSNTTIELGSQSRVIGSNVGIEIVYSDNVSLTNHGLIKGGSYSIYWAGDFDNTVVNRGTIEGDVDLGGGDDVFDTVGGTLTKGVVNGGAGDDTLITDNAAIQLKEGSDNGFDTVKSSVSYALSANVERLVLTGKADIDGTGTDGADTLIGNRGDNHLSGKYRTDTLDGGKGDDRLTGGANDDTFVFKTGYDHDTITDFDKHSDHDQIDLTGWSGIDSFSDVKQHWAMDHGDLVITLGDDQLILAGTVKADVHAADFIFPS